MTNPGAEASTGPADDGAQWQTRVVDMVEDTVATLHDRVIRPLLVAIRVVVFGSVVATMALVVSILFAIAVVRLLDVYAFGGRVWASDALVGGLLTATGFGLWMARKGRGDAGTS